MRYLSKITKKRLDKTMIVVKVVENKVSFNRNQFYRICFDILIKFDMLKWK